MTLTRTPPPASVDAPGFWRIARRPLWIGALVLALAIAAAFAALGRWQLERSVQNAPDEAPTTEIAVPIGEIAQPQEGVRGDSVGQLVEVSGEWVPGDAVALTGRGGGPSTAAEGAWLVGHLVTDDGTGLAVALGWAADVDTALAAAPTGRAELVGRYLAGESPASVDFAEEPDRALSVADLVNRWAEPGPVYGGYIVSRSDTAGVTLIDSPPPEAAEQLNLLNLFYAIEWAIFAGFAVYLWYRLVRDAQEKERDEALERAAASGA